MSFRVHTRSIDTSAPLLDLVPDPADALVWLRGDEGVVGWGVAARIEPGLGDDRFVRADTALQELAATSEIHDEVVRPGTGLIGIGSFTFYPDVAGSVLVIPRVIAGRHEGVTWLTTIDPPGAAPAPGPATAPLPRPAVRDRPRYAGSSNPDRHWLEAVALAIERIDAGVMDKVVLARDHAVWSHEPFDALDLARRLHDRFPSCHTFVMGGLVGATPELLLTRRDRHVTSRVLAGTSGRGEDATQDAAIGSALLHSAKDRAEHVYAVDSVTEVLDPICVTLTHDPEPDLLRLDNVQHLATMFDGQLRAPHRALEIVQGLHPTAAVGGTPRDVAMEQMRALERLDRGRYASPVGWTDSNGNGEWGIALRCAQLSGARARLFAGVGIVTGSLPEDELEETRLKLLAMQDVLDARPVEPDAHRANLHGRPTVRHIHEVSPS